MTVVFAGDKEATEFLLSILLSRNDLKVKSSITQKEKRNLFGRSVRLDIVAEDMEGKTYNVEVQRADKGASSRRVRYNLAMLDSHTLKKNDDFSALPETYIIFITENDYAGRGKPFYKVKKSFEDTSNGKKGDLIFDNGCHIMYVNGAYRGNDAIGYLMHDFCCRDADDMYYDKLAERVRFHKQQSEGIGTMCRIFEEYGNEVAAERVAEARAKWNSELVENLLRDGSLSTERISSVTKVPLEQVRQIAKKLATPVAE